MLILNKESLVVTSIVFLTAVYSHLVNAQTCTTLKITNGYSSTQCTNGARYTTVNYGGGVSSTTGYDSYGSSIQSRTIDYGNGYSSTYGSIGSSTFRSNTIDYGGGVKTKSTYWDD